MLLKQKLFLFFNLIIKLFESITRNFKMFFRNTFLLQQYQLVQPQITK